MSAWYFEPAPDTPKCIVDRQIFVDYMQGWRMPTHHVTVDFLLQHQWTSPDTFGRLLSRSRYADYCTRNNKLR